MWKPLWLFMHNSLSLYEFTPLYFPSQACWLKEDFVWRTTPKCCCYCELTICSVSWWTLRVVYRYIFWKWFLQRTTSMVRRCFYENYIEFECFVLTYFYLFSKAIYLNLYTNCFECNFNLQMMTYKTLVKQQLLYALYLILQSFCQIVLL